MPRETFQPEGLFASRDWGFSQVVVSPPGQVVSIAGQVPWNSSGELVAVGLEQQLRQNLAHLRIAIEAVGGVIADVQSLRIYVRDFQSGQDADLIARVLIDTFGDTPPASSWIGVTALAQEEYLVEVEALAVLPIEAAIDPTAFSSCSKAPD